MKKIFILTPSDTPDVKLVSKTAKTSAFPFLNLGKDSGIARTALETLAKTTKNFGVCFNNVLDKKIPLPAHVTKAIVPYGMELELPPAIEVYYQIHSSEEAGLACGKNIKNIIINKSDCSDESAFDIFRKIISVAQKNKVKVYVQGGVGVHTAAAFLALGAHGVVFDSQIALFPECGATAPAGQNLSLAKDLVEQYKYLKKFITAVFEAAYGHLHQAKNLQIISYGNSSGTTETEIKEQSKLILWERQIIKMLQKEKNISKFELVFSDEVNDAFLGAFVSIMAASAGAKGIKIKIAIPKDASFENRNFYRQLQSDTKKLLAELEDIPPVMPASEPLDIAIVGMDCIYPDAANVDEYWKNILLAKDCITEIPASHWDKDKLYKAGTKDTDYSFSQWGGFIPTMDFDPMEFGIIPQSLFKTEPLFSLSLLVVKRALKDAGYENLAECDFDNTSIFIGTNGSGNSLITRFHARFEIHEVLGEIPSEWQNTFPKVDEYSFPGILPNVLTGRIANRLNLGGANYAVDAACASSLVTLDIACQELASGRSDMVVMGGADFTNGLGPYLMFSGVRVLSSKNHCSPFDDSADGIVMGEGIGIVILKRLEDAEQDGNKIYAVIKGVGGSSNGRNLSVIAPSRKGEVKALEMAYQNSGILPSQVGLVEAHGTGTVAGDRVELSAMTDLFVNSGALPRQTSIGSVKSQIGHTKCAAGVGGLIKAALAVYHKIIPPTIHLDKVNAFYNPQTSPFVFNQRAGLWNDDKRIAGVSAFAFGGANFHAIIENYPENISEKTVLEVWSSELFLFRGDTPDEAKRVMEKIKKLLSLNNSLRLADIAYSLALYNDKEIQITIIAGSIGELTAKIDAALNDKADIKIFRRKVQEGKVVFLFSGEGSQYVNMARDLFVALPPMRRLLDKHNEYIRVLFPETAFDENTKQAQENAITDTNNALPILGIVDLAIAEYLQFLGIMPDMVAGHSFGELPALCFAGAIHPGHLVALSKARAKASLNAIDNDKGKLVAVLATEQELKPLLEGESEVWAVNYNSPGQIVVAGTERGMKSFMQKTAGKNIICREIKVDCAFHSPLMAKAEALFADDLTNFDLKPPKIPVWANMTAEIYPDEASAIKMHLAKHLISPIKFTQQIENMYEAGARIFIETGPGRILLGLVESILGKKIATISTENKSSEGLTYLLRALGQYLSSGKHFQVEKLFEGRKVSLLGIDQPEQYRKPSTGWLINGNEVYPSAENQLAKTQKNITVLDA